MQSALRRQHSYQRCPIKKPVDKNINLLFLNKYKPPVWGRRV
jgi:hypothetical protein